MELKPAICKWTRLGSDAEKGRRLPFDRNRRRISRRSAGFYCEEKKIKCRGAVSVVFPVSAIMLLAATGPAASAFQP
jgi:hypothetical protein